MTDRDWQGEIALMQERDGKSRVLLGVSDCADKEDIRRQVRNIVLELKLPDRNLSVLVT